MSDNQKLIILPAKMEHTEGDEHVFLNDFQGRRFRVDFKNRNIGPWGGRAFSRKIAENLDRAMQDMLIGMNLIPHNIPPAKKATD